MADMTTKNRSYIIRRHIARILGREDNTDFCFPVGSFVTLDDGELATPHSTTNAGFRGIELTTYDPETGTGFGHVNLGRVVAIQLPGHPVVTF